MSLWPSGGSLKQSAAYQELVQALETPGCPICTIAQRQARTHISGMLWDSVTDPYFRTKLDASLGFCGRHMREMLTFSGERLAITIVQQAIVKEAIRRLVNAPPTPRPTLGQRIQSWLSSSPAPAQEQGQAQAAGDTYAPCPACEVETRTEDRVAAVLVKHVVDDLDKPLREAGGLCRPHLYQCLRHSTPEPHAALIELHQSLWQELSGHLGEFIRKRDHRFHHETVTDAERDAVERSVHIITGGDPLYSHRAPR